MSAIFCGCHMHSLSAEDGAQHAANVTPNAAMEATSSKSAHKSRHSREARRAHYEVVDSVLPPLACSLFLANAAELYPLFASETRERRWEDGTTEISNWLCHSLSVVNWLCEETAGGLCTTAPPSLPLEPLSLSTQLRQLLARDEKGPHQTRHLRATTAMQ